MDGGIAARAARFVFLSDGTAQRRGLAPPEGVERVGWRLTAGNNRALGRSVRVFVGLAACREDARHTHLVAARATPSVTFDPVASTWSWQLALDGRVVAVGVHAYVRRVECQRGLAQFLAVLPHADPDGGIVRHVGPRALVGHLLDPAAAGASDDVVPAMGDA
ncbi:MAG: hypothetical protein ACTHMS_09425 [Jatrophihabitans sp.]|uniref:hypothetical protein n=1 Tax=Jatrophihabitans sp. TaxID=1932789 RepID=UPI003F7D1092